LSQASYLVSKRTGIDLLQDHFFITAHHEGMKKPKDAFL